jgi:hypothetical protein
VHEQAFVLRAVGEGQTMTHPPNPYDNLPFPGSTTEKYMEQGDWAALTADYLKEREQDAEQEEEKHEPK